MRSFGAGSRFALVITMLSALPAFAGEKPINLSIFPPIAIAKPEDSVTAFRFNLIYGKNTAVKVIDIGLVNHTTTGLSNGLQWGFANYTQGEFKGLQVAAININKGSVHGLQWGAVNYTENSSGLQLAVVNYARKMDGVQVGVVNIIKEGGMFPVMLIANWGK